MIGLPSSKAPHVVSNLQICVSSSVTDRLRPAEIVASDRPVRSLLCNGWSRVDRAVPFRSIQIVLNSLGLGLGYQLGSSSQFADAHLLAKRRLNRFTQVIWYRVPRCHPQKMELAASTSQTMRIATSVEGDSSATGTSSRWTRARISLKRLSRAHSQTANLSCHPNGS